MPDRDRKERGDVLRLRLFRMHRDGEAEKGGGGRDKEKRRGASDEKRKRACPSAGKENLADEIAGLKAEGRVALVEAENLHLGKERADIVLCPVNCNSHAACSLVKNLGRQYRGEGRVFIDTRGLREVCPFGRSTLQCRLQESGIPVARLYFQGARASEIAPAGSNIVEDADKDHDCKCSGNCTQCRCGRGQKGR